MRELERRHVAMPVEFRASADGGLGTIAGYAAKYNAYSQNLGGFVEQVAPGAFDKSLADNVRVMCRYNHSDMALLGTTEAGTLTLSSDDVGLPYECPLPDTSVGRDLAVLAKRGDVRYSSFAFYCIEDEWGFTEQGFPLRTVLRAQLVDVAPVNDPAYLDSTAALRGLAESRGMNVSELKGDPDAIKTAVEARAGKAISAATAATLQTALDALAAADEQFDPLVQTITAVDEALDQAQAAVSGLLGEPNPDDTSADAMADDMTSGRSGRSAEAEQRDTHSVPVSIQRLLLELNENK